MSFLAAGRFIAATTLGSFCSNATISFCCATGSPLTNFSALPYSVSLAASTAGFVSLPDPAIGLASVVVGCVVAVGLGVALGSGAAVEVA